MYIRVLSIRKHKTVSFFNTYSKEFGNLQFMVDNEISKNIKCGDLLNIEYVESVNQRNVPIKVIKKINEIIPCVNFDSMKGFTNDNVDSKTRDLIEARNGGKPIQMIKFKKDVVYNIKSMLNNKGFFDATGLTNVVENQKNGSAVKEAKIESRRDNEPKYLRITLENQLRQISALTLNSTFAIDKVFRNMGEDRTHINEFLMLEMVALLNDITDMIEFVREIDNSTKEIADKNNIYILDKKLEVIDYNEISASSLEYDEIRKDFLNTLVINFPCASPFIKKDEQDQIRKETRWYVNGHWISHFYRDENELASINEVLDIQKEKCLDTEINNLGYYEWGVPSTVSLGLSIDRWLQMLCGIENINSIANPLSLDYVKRIRR